MTKELTQKEKELLKRYENGQRPKSNNLKEEYLKQTDRNYKDGDRN